MGKSCLFDGNIYLLMLTFLFMTPVTVQVEERVLLRDYSTNTLSHVLGTLVFSLAQEQARHTATYTCASSGNREGPGVNSTTTFRWGLLFLLFQFF